MSKIIRLQNILNEMIMRLSHALKRLHVNTSGCNNGDDIVNESFSFQFIYSFATFQDGILRNNIVSTSVITLFDKLY